MTKYNFKETSCTYSTTFQVKMPQKGENYNFK
jgi:hypothetical protein